MAGLQSQTRKQFAGYQFHYRLKKDFSKESSPNKLRTTDTMIVPQMMAGDDNQNKNKKKNNNDDSENNDDSHNQSLNQQPQQQKKGQDLDPTKNDNP